MYQIAEKRVKKIREEDFFRNGAPDGKIEIIKSAQKTGFGNVLFFHAGRKAFYLVDIL